MQYWVVGYNEKENQTYIELLNTQHYENKSWKPVAMFPTAEEANDYANKLREKRIKGK